MVKCNKCRIHTIYLVCIDYNVKLWVCLESSHIYSETELPPQCVSTWYSLHGTSVRLQSHLFDFQTSFYPAGVFPVTFSKSSSPSKCSVSQILSAKMPCCPQWPLLTTPRTSKIWWNLLLNTNSTKNLKKSRKSLTNGFGFEMTSLSGDSQCHTDGIDSETGDTWHHLPKVYN